MKFRVGYRYWEKGSGPWVVRVAKKSARAIPTLGHLLILSGILEHLRKFEKNKDICGRENLFFALYLILSGNSDICGCDDPFYFALPISVALVGFKVFCSAVLRAKSLPTPGLTDQNSRNLFCKWDKRKASAANVLCFTILTFNQQEFLYESFVCSDSLRYFEACQHP